MALGALIIPAYNEAAVLADTLKEVRGFLAKKKLKLDVIVVNDGSRDDTGEIAARSADVVLNHRRNCGLGAAISTGIEYAKRQEYDYLITFDADGQHNPRDISTLLKQMNAGYDVVIGTRFRRTNTRTIPLTRFLVLTIGNLITFLFFGIWTSDSQSGFRALSRRAIQSIRLASNRMEVSSEIFGEIRRLSLRFTEVPIQVRYTKYSLQKGQKNRHALNILIKLILKILK